MPREFTRNQRLGNQVLRSLSELLRFETKDPRLQGVSLTAVDLEPGGQVQIDLAVAPPTAAPAGTYSFIWRVDAPQYPGWKQTPRHRNRS